MDENGGILNFPEMDEQHKYLYRIFDLLESDDHVTNKAFTEKLLKEIEHYINFHFTSEEHLMRMYEFPGFAIHQSDHEQAAMKFVGFMDDYDAGKLNPMALRLFLRNWLWEHSKESDTEYVKWIAEKRKEVGLNT